MLKSCRGNRLPSLVRIQPPNPLTRDTVNTLIRRRHCPDQIEPVARVLHITRPPRARRIALGADFVRDLSEISVLPADEDISLVRLRRLGRVFDMIPLELGVDLDAEGLCQRRDGVDRAGSVAVCVKRQHV
jgi:hypothetical protein